MRLCVTLGHGIIFRSLLVHSHYFSVLIIALTIHISDDSVHISAYTVHNSAGPPTSAPSYIRGLSAITMPVGRARMASAIQSTSSPSIQKHHRPKETVDTPEPLRQARSKLANTHAASGERGLGEKGFYCQICDCRSARGIGPASPTRIASHASRSVYLLCTKCWNALHMA